MKLSFIALSILIYLPLANAAAANNPSLAKAMVKNCKAEIAANPALKDTSDAEAVWKNIKAEEAIDKKAK